MVYLKTSGKNSLWQLRTKGTINSAITIKTTTMETVAITKGSATMNRQTKGKAKRKTNNQQATRPSHVGFITRKATVKLTADRESDKISL